VIAFGSVQILLNIDTGATASVALVVDSSLFTCKSVWCGLWILMNTRSKEHSLEHDIHEDYRW
jgi:hypothetical protein